MEEKKDVYKRTKQDLLNVIKFQGETCKKMAKNLRDTKRTLKEKENKITSLRYEIRQLRLEIRRLKSKER